MCAWDTVYPCVHSSRVAAQECFSLWSAANTLPRIKVNPQPVLACNQSSCGWMGSSFRNVSASLCFSFFWKEAIAKAFAGRCEWQPRPPLLTSAAFFSDNSSFSCASLRPSENLSSSSSVCLSFFWRSTSSSSSCNGEERQSSEHPKLSMLMLLPLQYKICVEAPFHSHPFVRCLSSLLCI